MSEQKFGIVSCVNCIGMHPDETVTVLEVRYRLTNPTKVIASKFMSFEKKKAKLYAGKTCMLCGRTYKEVTGDLDETWHLTAMRVKAEFDRAGITGVSDTDVRRVLATCRKSFELLMKNRATVTAMDAEKMTFAGRLALIITHAQEAREQRNTLNGGKGMLF